MSFEFSGKPEYYKFAKKPSLSFYSDLNLKAPKENEYDAVKKKQPIPLSLTCVIDRSFSMNGEPLDLVKQTMNFIGEHLKVGDKFGLIDFGTDVIETLPLTTIDENRTAIEKAKAAVASIQPNGSTNMVGGIFSGISQQLGKNVFVKMTGSLPQIIPAAPTPRRNQTPIFDRILQNNASAEDEKFADFDPRQFADPEGFITLELEIGSKILTPSAPVGPFPGNKRNWSIYVKNLNSKDPKLDNLFKNCIKSVKFNLDPNLEDSSRTLSAPNSESVFEVKDSSEEAFEAVIFMFFRYPFEKTENFDKNSQFKKVFKSKLDFSGDKWEKQTVKLYVGTNNKNNGSSGVSGVNTVFLLTDGHANVSIYKTDELSKAVQLGMRHINDKKKTTLFCFGVGTNHNEELMRNLVEAGNGMYYFIEKNEQIGGAFADALGGVLSIFAQEISIEVDPVDGVEIETIETAFPHRKEGNKWIIEIPDIYYEEKRDMLMKFNIKSLDKLTPIAQPEMERVEEGDDKLGNHDNKKEYQVAKAKLRFIDPSTKQTQEMYSFVKICVDNDEKFVENSPNNVDLSVDEQKNRLVASKALEEALKKNALQDAKNVIEDAKTQIYNSKSSNTTFTTGLLNAMKAQFEKVSTQQEYEAVGKKKLNVMSRAHHMQRNAYAGDSNDNDNMYQNQRQQQMQEEWKNK